MNVLSLIFSNKQTQKKRVVTKPIIDYKKIMNNSTIITNHRYKYLLFLIHFDIILINDKYF